MGHVPPFFAAGPRAAASSAAPGGLCDADVWSISRRLQPPPGLHKVNLPEDKLSNLSGRVAICFAYYNFFRMQPQ